jgi:hypothetical protein
LHNRTSQNQEAEQEIEKKFSALREEGKATNTLLWDRQRFISRSKQRLRDVIVTRMREDAEITLREQESLFIFGSVYLPVVPVSEKNGVWVAGFTGLTHTDGQNLVYLMQIGEAFDNFRALWNESKLAR